MQILLDEILVVDLEATCWEGKAPAGEVSEIIEIGIVPFDMASGKGLERESLLVQPVQSTVSPFCTSLTSITPEMVASGISLKEACLILEKKYKSRERAWASWGRYDRKKTEEECQLKGLPYPFSSVHINLKHLFSTIYGLRHRLGMAAALSHLQIPLEGTHHRGADDAWNIARILSSMMEKNPGAVRSCLSSKES